MKVGFIGTGTMGQPMLANLVKKGFRGGRLRCRARRRSTLRQSWVRRGQGRSGETGGGLRSGDHDAAVLGQCRSGLSRRGRDHRRALTPGRLCVDMSTIDPGTSQRVAARLKERGLRFLDAPVSGGVGGAAAGTLAIMVGGAAERPRRSAAGARGDGRQRHPRRRGRGRRGRQAVQQSDLGLGPDRGRRGVPHRRGVRRRSADLDQCHCQILGRPPGSWNTCIRSPASSTAPLRAGNTRRGS